MLTLVYISDLIKITVQYLNNSTEKNQKNKLVVSSEKCMIEKYKNNNEQITSTHGFINIDFPRKN